MAYGLEPLSAGGAKSFPLLNVAIIRFTDISDKPVAQEVNSTALWTL
jgi:hypothetical protein